MLSLGDPRSKSRCVIATSVLIVVGCASSSVFAAPAPPSHGVAAEVAPGTATLWARCEKETHLHFALSPSAGGSPRWLDIAVVAEHDFTGKVTFEGLAAETRYEYRAWCSGERPPDMSSLGGASGKLVTPPAPDAPRALRFAWGGDLGGQNACRDAAAGYVVLDRVREQSPDFFVALGDMIYADDACQRRGRFGNEQIPGPPSALTVEGYWQQWRYSREDAALQRLLAALPYYGVWDDHEINTDAGPQHDVTPDAPGVHLLPIARRAFVDYQPILEPAPRLYRSVRWGKHLELFLLDTRSYRDANSAPDDPSRAKTMLGEEERAWLLEGLGRSDATWKIIAGGVPISVPSSNEQRGRDGWASGGGPGGFENELRAILTTLRARGVANLVYLATDIHFATAFRYTPFPDAPDFAFHEFISGPLNAGVFARPDLDPTFAPERLFFHGPKTEIATYAEAKTWFNFGVVEVSEQGKLRVFYVDANGRKIWQSELREP